MSITQSIPNIGGILKVAVAPAKTFQALAHRKGQLQSLAFIPGASWILIEDFVEDRSGFRINKKNDQAGDIRQVEISIVFPSITSQTDEQLDEWQDEPLIVYVMDGNEKHRIFGTLDIPLEMEEIGESADSATGLNGYTVKFYGQSLKTGLYSTFDPLTV